MEGLIRRGKWPRGINNKANWRDMPEGTVRDSVNFDPLESGSFALRSDAHKVEEGSEIRGALAVGDDILFADGDELKVFNTLTNSTAFLANIDPNGQFVGAVLNSELFFCTTTQCLRYKRGSLRTWGVPTVTSQPLPTMVSGGLLPGTYQLAVTWVDDVTGEEGGTTQPVNIAVAEGQALSIELPSATGYTPYLYVSPRNASSLYLQTKGAGTYQITSVRDDTQRLETMLLTSPTPCSHMAEMNSVLIMAEGSVVWITQAMSPHLCRPMSSFFQFAEPVNMLIATSQGVYVSADKTWFLSGIEGEEPVQIEVFPFPAVAKSSTHLPDGNVAWMTPYGLAVSRAEGAAELISRENFVPQLASVGSSGIVQNNGNQLVVTTMPGERYQNPLVASDYYEAEIVLP